jgi:hypothetical protein
MLYISDARGETVICFYQICNMDGVDKLAECMKDRYSCTFLWISRKKNDDEGTYMGRK